MKRILAITGGIIAFSVAILVQLTAGAAVGDIVYNTPESAPVTLSAGQKTLLGAAISATAPGIVAAKLDALECNTIVKKDNSVETQCRAAEDKDTITDADFWTLVKNKQISNSASAPIRKKYGPVVVSDFTAWNAFTQDVWSKDMQALWVVKCDRPNPADLSVVRCQAGEAKTANKSTFRADWLAGNVAHVIGEVVE